MLDIVETLAADVRAPDRPPASFAELGAVFSAIDDPLAAELRSALTEVRPAAWAGEFDDLPAGEVWVVDALDGAVQLLQGLPQYCLTVTLVRDGEPELAVLHSPWLKETYAAQKGEGATRNGKAIEPSRKTSLEAVVAATSQPPFVTKQPGVAEAAGVSLTAVLKEVAAVRNLGPTSWQVADVAAGRLDLFWQYGTDATNLAGAALVAREAGAVVTTADGAPWTPSASSFLVAAPALHEKAVRILRQAE
ncbi:inositol monophosphatase family protein [Amycolatopsis vancoresmycina]|uniref:Inositol-phosphate phosphatase n=1 Tax=Amycolatopsis vancoresmycina DSM 44592 TaxID=1292037 RepID=R1FVW3_9PSEU|nr:inositol monophosphatase [Amycolatopsis vancoresmycina]EOD63482.1 Inositol-phosphate phosphatase [Amycolatopsis vancoresmycina DSM 44592]